MRIVHVTPYFAPAFVYGGPPRSVLGLCRALMRAGAGVSVVTTTADGDGDLGADIVGAGCYEGVPVTYLPRSMPRRDFRSAALPAALDRAAASADLVHIHGCWNFFGWDAARWSRRRNIPYIVSPRGMLYSWSFEQGRRLLKAMSFLGFEKPSLKRARMLHATTQQEAGVIASLDLGPEIVVVPNGLDDLDEPTARRSEACRSRYGAKRDDFLLLFLGRIHPKKGLDTLLAAVEHLTSSRRVVLVIAGAGETEYVASLRESARALVDAGRVAFAGHVSGDDRRELLASADGFALTSHSENFGMSVAEAMAAGLPVVVSRDCPWPQIEPWRAGFWVDNSIDAVSQALSRLAEDPAAARAMGENGRREAKAHLGWDHLACDMLEVYERAVQPVS
jgi:glycosyltransferase involved in cell wall biosynthesis